jgi:hypothetical protein
MNSNLHLGKSLQAIYQNVHMVPKSLGPLHFAALYEFKVNPSSNMSVQSAPLKVAQPMKSSDRVYPHSQQCRLARTPRKPNLWLKSIPSGSKSGTSLFLLILASSLVKLSSNRVAIRVGNRSDRVDLPHPRSDDRSRILRDRSRI